jgi:plasmid stability protein
MVPIYTGDTTMKTTLNIPDALLRAAKVRAARDGTTLRAVVTQALEAEIGQDDDSKAAAPWRKHFGGLHHLRGESKTIQAAIQAAFGSVDEDAWR